MALNDQPLCGFSSTALSLEPLLVFSWHGEEALSRPYRFEIRLASLNPFLDDEAMLGNPAKLTLTDAMGLPQAYHGLVTEVEQLDSEGEYSYYRVVLEPRMARLRQFRFSEIWLDKSLPDLIRDVLKETGLVREGPGTNGGGASIYDFDIRIPQDDIALSEASFTCQFEETSFDFLSRLLEYYGIYYFFEQQDDQEALVLCGDRRYQPQGEMLIRYRPLDSVLDAEHGLALTQTFKRRLVSQPRQLVLQDFSATNAQLQLHAVASVATASLAVDASTEQFSQAEVSPAFFGDQGIYGEHFGSNVEGQWLATRRAQAVACRHREFHGAGRAPGMRAGYLTRLIGHPRLPLNALYQVLQVQHDGSQPLPGLGQDQAGTAGDSNTHFIVLPADVQYRAPCITPKPQVPGLLSAIVDGDEDTRHPLLNDHGCYKVSFPFIRGEKAATRGSAWLRMATMSSGSGHGMHFPLLKGTEVLVSFLGGDPDRPIITAAVPNSENPNKVNASNATQSGLSTPGGHYFAMDDSQSGPLMKMAAPGGNTSFTLGNGTITGAHLQTDAHMQLRSSSLKHEIPGIYSLKIATVGVGDTPPAPTDNPVEETGDKGDKGDKGAQGDAADTSDLKKALHLTEALLNKRWGGLPLPKVVQKKAPSYTIELNTALNQTVANIGLAKETLTVQGLSGSITLGLFNFALNYCLASYQYSNGKKTVYAADMLKTLSKKIEAIFSDNKTEMTTVKTGIYKLSSTEMISMDVGAATDIKLLPDGSIKIKGNVFIDGNLAVTGNVTATETVEAKKVNSLSDVNAAVAINAPAVACASLSPAMVSAAAGPFVPPVVGVLSAASSVEAEAVSALGVAADAVAAALVAANEAVQAPLDLLQPPPAA